MILIGEAEDALRGDGDAQADEEAERLLRATGFDAPKWADGKAPAEDVAELCRAGWTEAPDDPAEAARALFAEIEAKCGPSASAAAVTATGHYDRLSWAA